MPGYLRKAIIQSTKSDSALKEAADILLQDNGFKSLVATTQAVDLIGGGVKMYAADQSTSFHFPV
jgi:Gly-Xaa carboxypeptidase